MACGANGMGRIHGQRGLPDLRQGMSVFRQAGPTSSQPPMARPFDGCACWCGEGTGSPTAPTEGGCANDAALVVLKPAGLLSAPGRGPDKEDCLLSRGQHRFGELFLIFVSTWILPALLFARSREAHSRHRAIPRAQDRQDLRGHGRRPGRCRLGAK